MTRQSCVILMAAALAGGVLTPAFAKASRPPSLDEVNGAKLTVAKKSGRGATSSTSAVDPSILRAQILLDRRHLSPGSIDGHSGDNFLKALGVFANPAGASKVEALTPELLDRLVADDGAPVLVRYTVTRADVKGPFVKHMPKRFEDLSRLPKLSYTSAREELAERFHMTPSLMAALNPGLDPDEPGTELVVAAVRPEPPREAISNRNAAPDEGGTAEVVRIEVDKGAHVVKAFATDERLVALYPASIGSAEKPAPSGSFKIKAIARDPEYRYDPKYHFKGVRSTKPFTIAAGPNNPVGAVWLDLSADSYGIHGTPEPEQIGRTASHGCIRLTNWDALDLASRAGRGTVVDFKD